MKGSNGMTKQEELIFEALTKDRAEIADALDRPAVSGYKSTVVDKYTDQAHFIYELLQNADDTGATYTHFELYSDRLVFKHNGKRQFTISDPLTEREDKEAHRLGDINAIASIANSNKSNSYNSSSMTIGKFGVGFKAVFQYTDTPHIYDPTFAFKIERFIVPIRLNEDYPGREPNETVFVFPFDHPKIMPPEAERDIAAKLSSLVFPILFLKHLERITFRHGSQSGEYDKEIEQQYKKNDTVAELLRLQQAYNSEVQQDRMRLFTRRDNNGYDISVGFFLDSDGNLEGRNYSAFCFFPTKEKTGLKFIIHAPFLLTDSREGIRAGLTHNKEIISELSNLAADSLLLIKEIGLQQGHFYITDSIFSIIPYSKDNFSDIDDGDQISFLPFFTEIKNKLMSEELLPTYNGNLVGSENAFWAQVPQLSVLFSGEQLTQLTHNDNAAWVFTSFGRQETRRTDEALADYIDDITSSWYNEDKLLSLISEDFIILQSVDWLHQLYKYLSETQRRMDRAKKMPIFLDSEGNVSAAFDDQEQEILFLPSEGIRDCRIISNELLKNEETAQFATNIGIKEPSIRDVIYNSILPQYEGDEEIETDSHFQLFFRYYRQCPQSEIDDFIELIKVCEFVTYYKYDDDQAYRGRASDLYYPSAELKEYFATKPETLFADFEGYIEIVGEEARKDLESFLCDLGIRRDVNIVTEDLSRDDISDLDEDWPAKNYYSKWHEPQVDGCKEIVDFIVKEKSAAKSVILWNQLLQIVQVKCNKWNSLKTILWGTYLYRWDARYNYRREGFASHDAVRLIEQPWILNSAGEFVTADDVTIQTLSSLYVSDSDDAKELISFLGIKEEIGEIEDSEDDNLSEDQRRKIALADKIEAAGITEEELNMIIQQREVKSQAVQPEEKDSRPSGNAPKNAEITLDFDNVKPSVSRVVKDIARRTQTATLEPETASGGDAWVEYDEDDYTKATVDYSKKIEQAKQKSVNEINRIAQYEELQQRALDSERYSFGWFCALLEMESLNSGDSNMNSKEVSISFSHVEREVGTSRTLVLKHPNRYIPQFMEDLADIPLVLHMGTEKKTVAIEVANVKSYTLRVKLKTNADIEGIDLSRVTEARIDAKNPVFLLEELRRQFAALEFDDDYNLQKNLCKNIEFVFGPPGTGKTTHLAQNVLLPMMQEADDLKVLVLTPTNKAADVLVKRIMEVMGSDTSYNNWLIRFGVTGDEEIEQSEVYRDKTFDLRNLPRSVTVTTIARFPYDYFMPSGVRLFLNAMNWDHIVIDEASMIPIANIVYPLYKKTPRKFIIAGDPFQIEPITSVALWKNENLYTMVQLDSFVEPKTIPHQYKVELLTTQYRSIPKIGEVFSRFAYGGILQHHRDAASQRELNVGDHLDVGTLNLIKFPVSKYESIYRAKRLQSKTPYHIYSALFSYEFVRYLANIISHTNEGKAFRIGVIAPYRAQADLIDKLMASVSQPNNVEVQVATIHGFQGDECDIIVAVFNPPPSISSTKEMFLNKRNIINVSISRARDYLFVIMPDDNTDNIANLRLVKRVEALFKNSGVCTEFDSHSIEGIIFNNPNYLEDNSFSTSHQNVNVYGLPEKCYEIRSEDAAVDVQIHDLKANQRSHQDVNATSASGEHSGMVTRASVAVTQTNNNPAQKPVESAESIVEPSDALNFYWLHIKSKICPCDGHVLVTTAVPVKKLDGTQKRINMLVCSECTRKFIIEHSLPNTINLAEYCVKGHELSAKLKSNLAAPSSTVTQKSGVSIAAPKKPSNKELVYSKQYGKGEVVGRSKDKHGTRITIRFSDCEKVFYE